MRYIIRALLPALSSHRLINTMARTKQTARKSTATPATTATNGTASPKVPLGPAGTKHEYKRVDFLYDNTTGNWIYRDSAPFTGQEVCNLSIQF